MIEFIEISAKTGFDRWTRVVVLHPTYKKERVQHRFLWWKWTTIEYTNIPDEEIRIIKAAQALARRYAEKGVTLARIVKYTYSSENSSAHVETWLDDFDGSN